MSTEIYPLTPADKAVLAGTARDDFYRAKFMNKVRDLYQQLDNACEANESLRGSIKRNESTIAAVKAEIDALISQ
jgi:hypothetical protein